MDTVIEHREQVIWDHAFNGFAVAVAEADPKPIQLGAAQEGFALWFKVVRELAHKINRTDPGERNLLVFAIWSKKIDRIRIAEPRGIQIAADWLLVREDKDHFLVSRGWGSVFQRNQFVKVRNGENLRIIKMYVMLSAFCLSTYCFH